VTFPSNLSQQDEALRAEVYWEEFSGVSIDSFESAVNQAIGEYSFFPKPNQIRELINFSVDQKRLEHETAEFNRELLPWLEPTPVGKEEAKKLLTELFNKLDPKPQLEGDRASEFERKRKIAKEKAKQLVN